MPELPAAAESQLGAAPGTGVAAWPASAPASLHARGGSQSPRRARAGGQRRSVPSTSIPPCSPNCASVSPHRPLVGAPPSHSTRGVGDPNRGPQSLLGSSFPPPKEPSLSVHPSIQGPPTGDVPPVLPGNHPHPPPHHHGDKRRRRAVPMVTMQAPILPPQWYPAPGTHRMEWGETPGSCSPPPTSGITHTRSCF